MPASIVSSQYIASLNADVSSVSDSLTVAAGDIIVAIPAAEGGSGGVFGSASITDDDANIWTCHTPGGAGALTFNTTIAGSSGTLTVTATVTSSTNRLGLALYRVSVGGAVTYLYEDKSTSGSLYNTSDPIAMTSAGVMFSAFRPANNFGYTVAPIDAPWVEVEACVVGDNPAVSIGSRSAPAAGSYECGWTMDANPGMVAHGYIFGICDPSTESLTSAVFGKDGTVTSNGTILANLDGTTRVVHEPGTFYIGGDLIVTGDMTVEGTSTISTEAILSSLLLTEDGEIVMDENGDPVFSE